MSLDGVQQELLDHSTAMTPSQSLQGASTPTSLPPAATPAKASIAA
ncbi:MAG: hypothetical protein JWQ33_2613, partial [Ramlibacter sp.]|nr:hypothetical protein [Ramlibacter sp.]